MAATKIHAIKATVHKSIEYITDEDKTDGKLLISTFACGEETAAYDFKYMNSMSGTREGENLAYHLIQSFAPGEVSFEEAHRIGKELADKHLDGKYSYVIATHINKEHVHNHIIFCATDNIEHKKYHMCTGSYNQIRSISDRLCREHNLSVIIPGEKKGMSYAEWLANKSNSSKKVKLRNDIFDAIKKAKDYEDFILIMKSKHYEVKGEDLGPESSKYLSFKPEDYGNFIRASHKNLGKGYTKEEIIERINKMVESRAAWKVKQRTLPFYQRNLIDTESPKIKGNERFERWADNENFEIATDLYARVGSIVELSDKISEIKEQLKDNRTRIVEIDKERKILSEQIKSLEIYQKTKGIHNLYESSRDKEGFLMENETELILFEGAKSRLKEMGITPSNDALTKLKEKLKEIEEEKKELTEENNSTNPQLEELIRQQTILSKYFGIDPEKEKEKYRKHKSEKRKDTDKNI